MRFGLFLLATLLTATAAGSAYAEAPAGLPERLHVSVTDTNVKYDFVLRYSVVSGVPAYRTYLQGQVFELRPTSPWQFFIEGNLYSTVNSIGADGPLGHSWYVNTQLWCCVGVDEAVSTNPLKQWRLVGYGMSLACAIHLFGTFVGFWWRHMAGGAAAVLDE